MIFFKRKKPESILNYQLQNLIENTNTFLLINLTDPHQSHEFLKPHEKKLKEKEILSFLKERDLDPSHPVVLFCEKGRVSKKVSGKLSEKGFKNVYVLEGGLEKFKLES